MDSTTCNYVINVKPNLWCCFFVFFICFLVRNIDMWKFRTTLQYTFPVWECMIRLSICAHCIIYHIISFGIDMTPMWHHCIFICFVYVMWFFTRPSDLRIMYFILEFFKYLSHQDSNDECILLLEMKHSQPHMTL